MDEDKPVEIKPNIAWGLVEETINVIIYICIAILVVYIPKAISGQGLIEILISTANTLGADISKKAAYQIIGYLSVFIGFSYVLLKVSTKSATKVILENNKVRVISSKVLKNEKIMRYSDIARITKKGDLLNSGQVIIETDDVTKPIIVNYVNPLDKTFSTAKEIIKEKIADEVAERIQASTSEEVPKEDLETIMSLIKKDSVGKRDLITTINNISKAPNIEDQKNIFKIVLKELTKTRKISKDDLKETIDYLKDKGILGPEDIKELLDLFFTVEESYAGFDS